VTALEDGLDARLAGGEHTGVACELATLLARWPLRERLWGQLMLALYRSGRPAEAIAAYQRARTVMVGELGIEPGTALVRLHRRILGADPALDPPATDLVPPVPVPRQLPHDIATFHGRDAELRRLDTVPSDPASGSPATAVAVLTGGPGYGKTALAVRWAHRVADRFPDGQLYLDLGGGGERPGLARPAIEALGALLRALGVPPGWIPTDLDEAAARYRSAIAGRRCLVVLDGAVDAAQVRPLLPGTSSCVVLVTSRRSLDDLAVRDGAIIVPVAPLSPAESAGLLTTLLGLPPGPDSAGQLGRLTRLCAGQPLALRRMAHAARLRVGGQLAHRPEPVPLHQG
jgi:hypothetical protein